MKLVYLVQVVHLGRTGRRLFGDWFMATTMGPYNEDVSGTCAMLIRRRSSGRRWSTETPSLDATAISAIDEVCDAFRGADAGSVQATVSRKGGAWERLWRPDPFSMMPISDPNRWKAYRRPSDRGPTIDVDHMLIDFRLLLEPQAEAA